MSKHFLAGIAFAALFAGSATAADIRARPSEPELVEMWTGGYAGISLGGRWADTTWTTIGLFSPAFPPDPTTTPASFNSSTFRAGGYVGYNKQLMPQLVVGLEGDLAWGRNRKTLGGIPGTFGTGGQGVPPAAAAVDSSRVTLGSDGSVRGRMGFLATPVWLVYATAGIAWQQVDLNATCSATAIPLSWCFVGPRNETFSRTMVGLTIGAGTEVMLAGNWLLRAEYRYTDYGNLAHTFFQTGSGFASGNFFDDSFGMRESVKTHTALVGLAFKFGYGAIVASY
jgi:outer membrane immunogenic protein